MKASNKKEKLELSPGKKWILFSGKTLLYLSIMLVLVYFYHYSHISGGSFVYNQF